MKQHKNVIFDLGRVLLHWDEREVVDLLHSEDVTFPSNLDDIMEMPIWRQYDQGLYKESEFIAALSNTFSPEHLELFFKVSKENFKPLKDGISLLKKKRKEGARCFLLSNMGFDFKEYCLKKFSFLNQLDGCVFSCDINLVKPNPAIFEYILDKYGLNPAETLFIDDREINVMTARAMGMDGEVHAPSDEFCKRVVLA